MEAEAVEAVKFLWKRKHFDERDWKRKRTRMQLILFGAGSGSKNSKGEEAEANSEAQHFKRSWKRKH